MIAWFGPLAAASPWDEPCADLGRETWGAVVDIVSHDQDEAARFAEVRVHRPMADTRLGQPLRLTRQPEPGMVLCRGDWVEVWYGAEVTLEEAGAGALVTVRGGGLVWLDVELRQVRGIADYYVLDALPGVERDTPVPVALGYSQTTASRQDSVFRVEVLDPGSGESVVSVSPDSDVFAGGAPRAHGVTLVGLEGGPVRVEGGASLRVGSGRVLPAGSDERDRAQRHLGEAKSALDGVASARFSGSPGAATEVLRPHHLVLTGVAVPDRVVIDGATQPPTSWRRARVDGERALVSVGRTPLADGPHEVTVTTWLARDTVRLETGPSTVTAEVVREGVPAAAGWVARRRFREPWVRAERLELRPSVGWFDSAASGHVVRVRVDGEEAFVEVREAELNGSGPSLVQLPVRAMAHGGRFWFEAVPMGGVVSDPRGESMGWAGVDAFAGLSGGRRLSWDVGLGAMLNPRVGWVEGRARQVGLAVFPAPSVRLAYGVGWTVAVDTRLAGLVCFAGDRLAAGPGACTNLTLDAGLAVARELGRASPFVRVGGRSAYTERLALDDLRSESEIGALRTLGIALGVAVRVGQP